MDLQVGGVSRFSISKLGNIRGYEANLSIATSNSGYPVIINDCALIYGSGGGFLFQLNTTTPFRFGSDLTLTRRGAANLRLGAADAAAPVAQTLSVQSVVAGTTNTAGTNLTITGSQGTGTGAGGSLIFQVAPAGSSGSAQNALATALTINSARDATFEAGVFAASSSPSAVAFGRNGTAGTGIYFPSAANFAIALNGTGAVNFTTDTLSLPSNSALQFLSGAIGAGPDLKIFRDAANTLALRNGVNAQVFNVYNTFTDASNYERGFVRWSSNVFEIGPEKAGTGADRGTRITSPGGNLSFRAGTAPWEVQLTSAGHFNPASNNNQELGSSGNNWKNFFLSNYQEIAEMTAPAAPATNKVRIYAVDNGSGKTQLMALFATGAAQQIAIEP
jgi:hypothetical protein